MYMNDVYRNNKCQNKGGHVCILVFVGDCSFFMNTLNVIYRVPTVTENLIFIPGKVMGNYVVHVNVSV